MLDIKFVRNNPEIVKQNIKNKFQDEKLPLVDEVIRLDQRNREIKQEVEALRAEKNKASKQIGAMMAQKKIEEAEALKKKVSESAGRIDELSVEEKEVEENLKKIMMTIPNIIDPSVPIGKDDSENVELERYGEPVVPDFEIPYHTDIMESFNGIDLDSARRVAGNGFYYLMGDIARLHSAVISYARDFMIGRGFTYCIPPFMIRSNVVTGVMSFAEMDAMMYKIEGEDLYLIGTSEHSMIGKFINTQLSENELPQTLTSYSPCFRKEKGAHGIEERGVYRIHQFEKQEMIVVCKPEESMQWYDKLWQNTVDLFRSMDIPVRTLECCSGDLADLKVKSVDVEAWSPRQKKYFEVGSCSNLGDAQARRLGIRVKGENGNYFAHTLNNTVVAPPRMLIAFLENNLQADGSVKIPEVLRPYMGGNDRIVPKNQQR
ncbi:MAG TPA: serine--tRNA ligase [Candidatus Mediterraneibacter colneyensis]|nr:serine--tRNA ligase [Candidatus Mediterraneibacter colneyensis]